RRGAVHDPCSHRRGTGCGRIPGRLLGAVVRRWRRKSAHRHERRDRHLHAAADRVPGDRTDPAAGDGRVPAHACKKFYGLDQGGATSTIQNMAFFLKPGASGVNYTFSPGQIKVRSDATGNRYTLVDAGNFTPANATLETALMLRVQADAPGKSFSDPAGTILTI